MKRKWKIENNDKEEVQFQTLQKAPEWRAYEEGTFHQESKKVFTWLQFDECRQSFAVFMVNFPPSRNILKGKCK